MFDQSLHTPSKVYNAFYYRKVYQYFIRVSFQDEKGTM